MGGIVVVGAGAWGSALAGAWAGAQRRVTLLSRRRDASGGAGITVTNRPEALGEADIVVLAVPAQETRSRLGEIAAEVPADVPVVLTAKGLERGTLARQSEIAGAALPKNPLAVFSGPSFAVDVGRGLPTALTLAADFEAAALQEALATPALRLYLTDDVTGVEIGGALKNVIAIACGAVIGAGYGESARAALMTRGLAEMTRLAVAMGARPATLAGLSGLGDLALTSTSERSRNFSYGLALGRGEEPSSATTEGVATARAASSLAAGHGLEAPIADAVADILDGRSTLRAVVQDLLARPLRSED